MNIYKIGETFEIDRNEYQCVENNLPIWDKCKICALKDLEAVDVVCNGTTTALFTACGGKIKSDGCRIFTKETNNVYFVKVKSNNTEKIKIKDENQIKQSKKNQELHKDFRTQLTKQNIYSLIGKKIEFFAPSDNGGVPIYGKTTIRKISTDFTAPIQEAKSIVGYDICSAFFVKNDNILHFGDKGKNVTYRISKCHLYPVDTYAVHILEKYNIRLTDIARAAGVTSSFVYHYFHGIYNIKTLKRRRPEIYRGIIDFINNKIDVESDKLQDCNFNRQGTQYGEL